MKWRQFFCLHTLMKSILRNTWTFITKKIPKIAKEEWNPRLRGKLIKNICAKFKCLLKGEIKRTMSSVAFLIIMIVFMTSAQVFSDHQYGEYVKEFEGAIREQNGTFPPDGVPYYAQVPLHDRVFTAFPDLTEMRSWLPDMFLTSLLGSTILFNVFWIHKPRMEYQGFVVARRMLWMLVTLYFFRTWSFLGTTVPSPLRGCTGKYLPENITTREMVPGYLKLIGQMATGSVTACTDNIYSGHTSLITILVMTFIMYSGINWLKVYATIHGAVALLTIVITRLHYTVDVYIALLVASFVFLNYHFLLIIFLQGRLERYHAIKAAHIADFDSSTTEITGEDGIPKTESEDQIQFNRKLLEKQMALDMKWLKDEKRIIWRVIWLPIGQMIWWMDGMDLRRPFLDPQSTLTRVEKEDPAPTQFQSATSPKSNASNNVAIEIDSQH